MASMVEDVSDDDISVRRCNLWLRNASRQRAVVIRVPKAARLASEAILDEGLVCQAVTVAKLRESRRR